MRRNTLVLISLTLCLGCGYSSQYRVPAGVETIAVDVFDNRTQYREVEFDFTRALRREVTAKTSLDIARADVADACLSGEVLRYSRRVLRETERDRPTEYSISMTVDYTLVNQRTGEVISKNPRLSRRAEYQLLRRQTESDAREEVVRELARELVQDAFLRWE